MCHGARGLSQADTPNLTGQYPVAIYKELVDFKTGARQSAVMAPLVADLSDKDMRELAAYYAYLPRPFGQIPAADVPPSVVSGGAPMRGIAPCGACHGDLADKPGAPWPAGQPFPYLLLQLNASASGAGTTTPVNRCATPRASTAAIASTAGWDSGGGRNASK